MSGGVIVALDACPECLVDTTLDEAAECLDLPSGASGRLWALIPPDPPNRSEHDRMYPDGEYPEPDHPNRVRRSIGTNWHRIDEADRVALVTAAMEEGWL